jgi:hypothetical protein
MDLRQRQTDLCLFKDESKKQIEPRKKTYVMWIRKVYDTLFKESKVKINKNSYKIKRSDNNLSNYLLTYMEHM